jgi:Holliday junction resolvase
MPRRAPKRDANERDIIDDLRDLGAKVIQLDIRNQPDLLVGWRGLLVLVEVKTETGQLSEGQRQEIEDWRDVTDFVMVARSTEDVITFFEDV